MILKSLKLIILEIQLLQIHKLILYFLLLSLYLFCTLFFHRSQNNLGRQDVPFLVLGHIFQHLTKDTMTH